MYAIVHFAKHLLLAVTNFRYNENMQSYLDGSSHPPIPIPPLHTHPNRRPAIFVP
jgi:hypothetical protein